MQGMQVNIVYKKSYIMKTIYFLATRYGGRITAEEVLDSIFQNTTPANESYQKGYFFV